MPCPVCKASTHSLTRVHASRASQVLKKEAPDIIDRLIAVGATDILVFALSNCRV